MTEAPEIIHELVERFERNIEAYKRPGYNEEQLKQEFLNLFFEALGWDVYNRKGKAPQYRDVIFEDSIKVGGGTRAPDYCFTLAGTRMFFVEAKKPSVNVKMDIHPAFQLRRYAWSAKLPISILTDFEEFAVYELKKRPKKDDRASTERVMYYTFDQYVEKWDEIYSIFSKDALYKGSLDKFIETRKGKRGTQEVDDEFLKEMERWRLLLAKNLALRNDWLSGRLLNHAVQLTIDRILFLRMGEDRGIEKYEQLQRLVGKENIYRELCGIYKRADDKYNSGLFHFRKEKGRGTIPDDLTLRLDIDDKILRDIISHLYYPDSPYEFSVLSPEILGHVYEQFLGKVIRLTKGHRAKVEDKPEVKKAGGVYYTPKYIVDYIVENTVGKLCKGKTPDQVSKLHILDPACGSGSFLLGAYSYLLKFHRDHYSKMKRPERHHDQIYKGPGGEWFLTIKEKKRILLNNIYGVDIDSQAVEVTKLSLLLKVLEGERGDVIEAQQKLWQERALPDLGNNIKCGNSLIGPDFYSEGVQTKLFDEQEMYRINAFDWSSEFKEIMGNGGFDAVIGNPPWLMAGYYEKSSLGYFRKKFKSAGGKFDLYYLFIEQGCSLVSNNGVFGMIVPNKIFHTNAASNLRTLLSKPRWIRKIIDFGYEQVFPRATNYSAILLLEKHPGLNPKYVKAKAGLEIVKEFDVPWSVFSSDTWYFEDQRVRDLFKNLESIGVRLEKIVTRFGTGVQTGADRLFTLEPIVAQSKRLEPNLLRPVLRGRDVRRYKVPTNPKLLMFPYKILDNEFVILQEEEIQKCANIYNLLVENKEKLAKRVWFGKGAEKLSGKWYGMMYLDSNKSFTASHILTPSLSNRSNFMLGSATVFVTGTAGVTSIIPKKEIKENILYLLGVLNSRLISFYAISHSPVFSGGYFKFSSPYLKKLPIRTIDFDNPADKARHDKMVSLVEQMLDLHKKLAKATIPHEKQMIQRQIDATDRQIDALVYELYELTEEEIKIVEGNGEGDVNGRRL